MLKICTDCGTPKPLTAFYKAKGYANGILSRCKECHRKRTDAWRAAHRDEVNEGRRACNMTPAARQKERVRQRRWRQAHPRERQAAKRRHRARKYGSGGRHTEAEWQALLAHYGHRCLRCGAQEDLSRDHVVPLTAGGTDSIDNIQPLCRPCNAMKGNRIVADYRNGTWAAAALPVRERVCAHCAEPFSTTHWRKRFCTDECKVTFFNREASKRRAAGRTENAGHQMSIISSLGPPGSVHSVVTGGLHGPVKGG